MTVQSNIGVAEPVGESLSGDDLSSFNEIAQLAHSRAGLVLSKDKAPMVLARVGKRIRALGLRSLKEYCQHLQQSENENERRELIFTLTTNVTSFMREEHHFQMIENDVVPLIEAAAKQGETVRLWSAGCSSGQEPYSLAMILLDKIPNLSSLNIRILATDIDPHILDLARRGEYTEHQLGGLSESYRNRFFHEHRTSSAMGSTFIIEDAVKDLISFKELNLLSNWPMKKKFQAILCRNVVIYFDRETQKGLWGRFSSSLSPSGFLFLGHSERIDTTEFEQFKAIGTTTYQLMTQPR